MPRVRITLNDGTSKIVNFSDGFTDADIDEVANTLNSQLAPPQKETPQETPKPQPQAENKPLAPMEYPEEMPQTFNLGVEENVYNHDKNKWHDTLRQAGRNTARFLLPKSWENKFIGSKEDEEFLNKYNNSNVPTWEQINNDYKSGRINKKQMLEFGNLRNKLDTLSADAEYRDYRNKEYGKEALLLGSSVGGGAGLAAKGVAGLVGGAALGGAGYGLGKSLIDEDLNPLIETPKEAALWGGTAGILGKGGKMLAETPAGQKVLQKGGELVGKGFEKIANTKTGQKVLNELTKERQIIRPRNNQVPQKADYTQQLNEIKDIRATNKQALQEELDRINKEYKEELKTVDFMHTTRTVNQKYKNLIKQTKKEYNALDRDLQAQAKQIVGQSGSFKGFVQNLKDNIKGNKFTDKNLQVTHNSNGKGGVFTTVLQNEDNAVIMAEREFNNIINEIAKNPQRINDTPFINDVEARIQKIIDDSPYPNAEEFAASFWERYTKAVEDAYNYNMAKGTPKNNYFGGETPSWLDKYTGGTQKKKAGLVQSMKEAGTLPPELAGLNPEYQVLHNAELSAQATKDISENATKVLDSIDSKASNADYQFTDLDFEQSRQLLQKLYNEGRIDKAIELQEAITKKATEAGRAVQALSMWSRTTPEGAIKFAQKVLNKYNAKSGKNLKLTEEQGQVIIDLTKKIQAAAEGREQEVAVAQLMKYVSNLTPKSWTNKYDTYRYMNMLLSGKSRNKDFFLTGLNTLDNAIDEGIANVIDAVRTRITGGEKAFGGLQPNTWFQGAKKGFREGVEDVTKGINTSRSGEAGRYGLPKTPSFEFKPVREQGWESITNNPITNSINNVLAGGEKALGYSLQVPDRMFYEGRFAASLKSQMKAAGVDKPTSDMIAQANKEALEAVYQDKSWVSNLGNATRNAIDGLTTDTERALGLSEGTIPRAGGFVAPFVTTPANIVNQGLKNTGGAIPGTIKLFTAKTPQQIRDAEMLIAKNIKGALGVTGFGLGLKNGLLKTNIGDNDYQENAITGLRPQSIIIGDKAVSLKDYPQLSVPLSAYMGYQQGGTGKALLNVGQAVSDISALKTLGDLVGTVKSGYGQELSAPEIADNMIRTIGTNILTQNIPFGGALGELRNDIDPYARELYTPDTPQYVANRVMNRLPGVSKSLPMKYNAVGEPVLTNNIQNPLLRAVSEDLDFGIRNYNENPTYNQFRDFKEAIKDSDIRGKTTVGISKAPRTVKINGENVKLNNKQYSEFQKAYGKNDTYIKSGFAQSPQFLNMSAEEQVKLLSDYRTALKDIVLYKQFGAKPPKRPKNIRRIHNDILNNYID